RRRQGFPCAGSDTGVVPPLYVGVVADICRIKEEGVDDLAHTVDGGVVVIERGRMLIALDLAAAADHHHAAGGQYRRIRRGVDEQVDRAHRVPDEVRGLDTDGSAEPRDV